MKKITYPEYRPAEPAPIGEKYCEHCKRNHPIFPPDIDFEEHTVQNMVVDIMEEIDNAVLEDMLREFGEE